MRILFTMNVGGFAEWIDLDRGMTIEEFFSKVMPDYDEMDCLIRINSKIEDRYYLLRNNDRITIIPLEGLGLA